MQGNSQGTDPESARLTAEGKAQEKARVTAQGKVPEKTRAMVQGKTQETVPEKDGWFGGRLRRTLG